MEERKSADPKPRLRQAIILCTICVTASGFGMFFAHPVAARFRMSSPWVLPAIAVATLIILAVVALIVLPRITSRRA